jgi:ABC-type phosphate transport system substrate-binding protein
MRRALCLLVCSIVAFRIAVADADAGTQAASPSAAIAIIVHRSNPVDGLTSGELRRIFLLETASWPNGRKITVVLRDKGQPERAEAIRMICGISEADFDRHVLFQTFRGSVSTEPRSIQSAAAMQRFVFNAPGAIGYVRADQLDGSTKVLRIDGRLPSAPDYPLRRSRRARGDER